MSSHPRRPVRGFLADLTPFEPGKGDPRADAVLRLVAAYPNALPMTVNTRVLELAGYLPGDVVVIDLDSEPRIDDVVAADIGGELVLRIYERAGAADVLVSSCMDPSLRQPVAVDDRVRIRGVVGGLVRTARRAG